MPLAVIDRELTTDSIGLSLAEGKALLASAQQQLVRLQCERIAAAHVFCRKRDAALSAKGVHRRQIRTVFGRVEVRSVNAGAKVDQKETSRFSIPLEVIEIQRPRRPRPQRPR